jgi:hypothetical protein
VNRFSRKQVEDAKRRLSAETSKYYDESNRGVNEMLSEFFLGETSKQRRSKIDTHYENLMGKRMYAQFKDQLSKA